MLFFLFKGIVRCLIFGHVMKQTAQEALESSSDKSVRSRAGSSANSQLKGIRWLTLWEKV